MIAALIACTLIGACFMYAVWPLSIPRYLLAWSMFLALQFLITGVNV
jgi:hypothetical protein